MGQPAKPIGELLAGLDAQIAAIRGADLRPSVVARLADGRSDGSTASGPWSYTFRRQSWPVELQPDRGLLVRTGPGRWHPVRHFEPVGQGRVRIQCDVSLGPALASGELCEDPSRYPETVSGELKALTDDRTAGRLDRARLLLGMGRPRQALEARPERWVSGFDAMNPGQRRAVSSALASDVTFVWGPPGTGKTEVVAHVVEGAVSQGLTVLLVAPTNVAVDQALERICELVAPLPGFDAGLVQRLGDLQVASLAERYGDYVDPERTVARCSAGVEARLSTLQSARAELTARLLARRHADDLSAQLHAMHAQRSVQAAGLDTTTRALAEIERSVEDLAARIAAAENGRGFAARRSARRLPEWRADLIGLHDAAAKHTAVANDARLTLDRLDAQLTERSARATAAASTAGPQSLAELERWSVDLGADIAGLETQRSALRAHVAGACRLLATTTHRAVQSRLPLAAIDVVVIDEAGMLDLPSAFLLASKAGRRLVVAGDPRQLPAVVPGADDRRSAASRRLIEEWVAKDAFHAAGVVGPGARSGDARLARLDTQYRMRPAICRLVNAMAYPDAPLLTGRTDEPTAPVSAVLSSPVVLIDTAGRVSETGTAYRNEVHAIVVRELLRLLQRDGVLPARRSDEGAPTDRLAVIAPYRQQVSLLRSYIKERFGASYDGLVDTVHRFQGSQRPVVVVDTVTGAGRQVGRFYDGVGLDAQTTRLMNVAVSRARDHLVLVANVPFLRAKLPAGSQIRVLLDEVEAVGTRLAVEDLVPVRTAADLARLSAEESVRPAFFPADESDRAVEWDLSRARSTIEVYCPFLSLTRVRRFSAVIGAAVRRGAAVTVYTRSTAENPSNTEPAAALAALGCTMRYRDQMHEKVVLVDDVLWHGSLNLFSHTRSTELMMRVQSPAACEEVRRVVQRAQPTRARGVPRQLPEPSADRVYLDVPYAEKDEAKKNGARWDAEKKLWWVVPARLDRVALGRWLPPS